MKELEEKILEEGIVIGPNILKVDSFLNQQIDCNLIQAMGKAFAEHFKDKKIDKVLTVESSGIAPALATAIELGVKCVFARKQQSLTTGDNVYHSSVYSFTKQVTNELIVSKNFLKEDENVLMIDDFLANGQAAKGMVALVRQAGANPVGFGIVIEKSFSEGRDVIENEMGLEIYSLARIAKLEEGKITFVQD
ncbi:xanthine phosphoribosyltransferase [Anaerococcus tetradius]|uniref:Xanthine phosphoribosyltransferase n=1 Tax=Anaerococcus tetradius ATCC 35098 TaxID=525255 RepID=C2CHF5_9FIRM|nr:xanthine phosphoribosyltransferase [Anaerococcus tetradius]EEI83037.1 xanthine phosphoribosyltransferase [Anaerococcus tetradius ATCC 35098]